MKPRSWASSQTGSRGQDVRQASMTSRYGLPFGPIHSSRSRINASTGSRFIARQFSTTPLIPQRVFRPIVTRCFSWEDWAERSRMSSAEPFEAIVCEHYKPLYRFAMSLTRVEADAEDLTQQTFFVWATKGHQIRDISKVKAWLFTTLYRAFLVARQRQGAFSHEAVSEELPAASPAPADPVDCSEVLPALTRVDEAYRAAVALFYLEG